MKRNLHAMTAILMTAFCAIALTGCAKAAATPVDTAPRAVFAAVADRGADEPAWQAQSLAWADEQNARQDEQEAAEAAEQPEPDYGYQEAYYGAYTPSYSPSYDNSFQSDGVAYIGDTEFNWYSQRVLPGNGLTELNENGRHVDEESGFVMDGDGYIAVASPHGQDEIGTVVETPYGQGKVYDENDGDAYDLYTDF